MMRPFAVSLSLGSALVLSAALAEAQEFHIRLAHSLSSTEPAHLAAEYFAENVAERTDGRVEINVFPGEQLGTGREVNEMIRQGLNVMNITDPGYLSDFVPDFGVLNGPYLLSDPLSFTKILESEWYEDIDRQLQEAGFRVVSANNLFGARHILADRAIRNPDDVEGVTIRVPPNVMWIETFSAMGARPQTVEWAEVYNALAQNVVDGAEAPLGSLYGSRLHEVRDTLSMTSHFIAWINFIMSEQYFQSLPADIQEGLLEEGFRAGEYMTELTLEMQDEFLDRFKEAGIEIVDDVDIAAFQEATASVYEAFDEWTPGLRETIMEILAD
jgi:TRAP-type transport system periplasmic protein